MEVIVKDTSFIIDVCTTGLIYMYQQTGLEFNIPIEMYSEIEDSWHKELVEELIKEHILHLYELTGEDAIELQLLIFEDGERTHLSPLDYAVLILAKKYKWSILTDDPKIQSVAEKKGIEIRSTSWLDNKVEEEKLRKQNSSPIINKNIGNENYSSMYH